MAAKRAKRSGPGRPKSGKRDPKTGRVRAVGEEYSQLKMRLPPETHRRVKRAAKREGATLTDYFLAREKIADNAPAVLAEVRRKVDEWFQPHFKEQERRLSEYLVALVKDASISGDERDRRMDHLAQQFARARSAMLEKYQQALAVESERALEGLASGAIKRPSDVRIATDPPDLGDLLAVGA